MIRLFLSLYLFLVVALVGLSALLESIIFENYSDSAETHRLAVAVAKLHSDQQVIEFSQQTQLSLNTFLPNELALPETQKSLLESQGFFLAFNEDGKHFIYVQPEQNILQLVVPPPNPPEHFFLYSASFFSILAVLIALWTYPLWRDIRRLEKASTSLKPDGSLPEIHISSSSTVSNIATALVSLSQQVQSLFQTQRELTSAVAHEFRTPLARMKFAMESIPNEVTKLSLSDDILELEHLVQEMLEFSQSQHNQPELSLAEIDLSEFFLSLKGRLPLMAKNIQFHHHCDCPNLIADGHFVERAVLNLLNNAVKYTQTQILLSCRQVENTLEISVEDDGEGVPEKDRTRIFEPFYRPDASRNRSQGGAGLGLAIVARVMSWHKGATWVEPSQFGGAKFVLSFPNKQA